MSGTLNYQRDGTFLLATVEDDCLSENMVEGVKYPDGSHSEAIDRGERVLNQIRDLIGME